MCVSIWRRDWWGSYLVTDTVSRLVGVVGPVHLAVGLGLWQRRRLLGKLLGQRWRGRAGRQRGRGGRWGRLMVGRLDAASVKYEVKGNQCSGVLHGQICLSEQVKHSCVWSHLRTEHPHAWRWSTHCCCYWILLFVFLMKFFFFTYIDIVMYRYIIVSQYIDSVCSVCVCLTWTCAPWSQRQWWGWGSGWGWRPEQRRSTQCCPETERTLCPAGSRCSWWPRSWPSDWTSCGPPSSGHNNHSFRFAALQKSQLVLSHWSKRFRGKRKQKSWLKSSQCWVCVCLTCAVAWTAWAAAMVMAPAPAPGPAGRELRL